MLPVLAVNAGSSSLKFALFDAIDPPNRVLAGKLERVNDPKAATDELFAQLDGQGVTAAAIGHRLVHGGPMHVDPCVLTPDVIRDLESVTPLDPAHLPAELALIAAFAEHKPGVPQVACFDTAFHRSLPQVAKLLPIPRNYFDAGVRRYGFHGLSYQFLMEELTRIAPQEATGRVILAHLGSGGSMAAVKGGTCIDTTMGFTPAGGLVMGTRTGDLDPGVLIHLARTEGFSADQLDRLVNRESGLLGLSGTSADVRDLLAQQASDSRVKDALNLFTYQAAKSIGALSVALGGLDTLVFSGGVGENATVVRSRICDSLGFLNVRLDMDRNNAGEAIISNRDSAVTVRVIRTDEEVTIARTVYRLLHKDKLDA